MKKILLFVLIQIYSLFSLTSTNNSIIGKSVTSNYQLESGFVFLLTDTEPSSIEENIPLQFELCHNYPNPFNPVTTIQYTLPVDQFVKLSVYNIKGEVVSELVNGNVKAGIHRVNFNGSDLVSGQYFYRIETQGFSKIRKMLLIK